MKDNEYKCAMCGGVFEKGWTDEEAMEEYKENDFPDTGTPLEVICDDCYQEFMRWHRPSFRG